MLTTDDVIEGARPHTAMSIAYVFEVCGNWPAWTALAKRCVETSKATIEMGPWIGVMPLEDDSGDVLLLTMDRNGFVEHWIVDEKTGRAALARARRARARRAKANDNDGEH